MIWISLVTLASYFSYSLIGDALDLYRSVKIPDIIRSLASFNSPDSLFDKYYSAIKKSLLNFITIPIILHTIPVEITLPLNLQLVRFVFSLLFSVSIYLAWIALVGKGEYRYRMEIGAQDFFRFVAVSWVAILPLRLFPLGQCLIAVYSMIVTIFLVKKNLATHQNEQRIPPLFRKRTFYTIKEGSRVRPRGV